VRRLVETLQSYLPEDQLAQITAAYEFGAAAHAGQKRKTGEAYITHPVAVAQELADMHLDAQAITAAILHDTVEDTDASLDDIAEKFGSEVALLVDGVSKLDQIKFRSRAEAQAESFRKMMLAMIEDIRVILVKLADRLHNMQTLGAMPADKKRRIARETLDVYAPIANRLGINRLKVQLEDLGFKHLHPFRYRVLENALKKSQGSQKQIVKKISEEFGTAMADEGIEGEVVGRQKHLYSIYNKMAEKKRLLACTNPCRAASRITSRFRALMVISHCTRRCSVPRGCRLKYRFGHAKWIALPSRALHRTGFTKPMKRPMRAHNGAPVSGYPTLKSCISPYVFTPKGDIMPLPKGATTVDFAYAVHTDVGNRCVSAKINRGLVPLRTELQNRNHHCTGRKTESELADICAYREGQNCHSSTHEESALIRVR